jgi:hypothetical protein
VCAGCHEAYHRLTICAAEEPNESTVVTVMLRAFQRTTFSRHLFQILITSISAKNDALTAHAQRRQVTSISSFFNVSFVYCLQMNHDPFMLKSRRCVRFQNWLTAINWMKVAMEDCRLMLTRKYDVSVSVQHYTFQCLNCN